MQFVLNILSALLLLQGSLAQIPTECKDDASFKLNGKSSQTCKWASSRKTAKRCRRTNRSDKLKVADYCPLTCKEKCAEYKTDSPTSSPTPIVDLFCYDDDPDYEYKGNSNKNCDWVAANPVKRCKKKDQSLKKRLYEFCPSACNLKCQCKDSNNFRINSKNRKKKKCKQVRPRQCENAKTSDGTPYSDYCPKKCGTCFVFPSESPTIAPTTTPSAAPTALPSGKPTPCPSASPTGAPSASPTKSQSPSGSPSSTPSVAASGSPSAGPTGSPSLSFSPTFKGQTRVPSASPSDSPSTSPSTSPSDVPSGMPSAMPTETPQSTVGIIGGFPADTTTDDVKEATILQMTARLLSASGRRLQVLNQNIELTVDVQLQDCGDTFASTGTTLSNCMYIETTIKVTNGYTVDPTAVTEKVEDDVESGDFAEESEALGLPAPQYAIPPSEEPSEAPTEVPSSSPSVEPSGAPSVSPSAIPSAAPSATPTASPSASIFPSGKPSAKPSLSSFPSQSPSVKAF